MFNIEFVDHGDIAVDLKIFLITPLTNIREGEKSEIHLSLMQLKHS